MSRALPLLIGAGGYPAKLAALRAHPPGGAARWERTNFVGRQVSLLGGVAAASSAVAAALCTPAPAGAVVAALGGGAFGAVDDLASDSVTSSKGLKGHLGALAHGELTTGSLKIAGIGASGLVASALLTPRPRTPLDVLVGAGLIAGTANLLNLFDLRPGRTLKVATAAAAVGTLAGSERAAAVLGVGLAALRDDLGERTMLGDTGANALGALLGTAMAASPSRATRYGALAVVVGLTLASEKVSFSSVIQGNGLLRRIDQLGRRPS
ncbi:MAG: hypothetical protein ACQERF_00045 [Actinomycetota bacterium]